MPTYILSEHALRSKPCIASFSWISEPLMQSTISFCPRSLLKWPLQKTILDSILTWIVAITIRYLPQYINACLRNVTIYSVPTLTL